MTFSDFSPAPNQGARPDLYELENRAIDPDGVVLAAMRELAPWANRALVDLGCGSGYWLPGYAEEAGAVIGVEPDPALVPLAAARDRRARGRERFRPDGRTVADGRVPPRPCVAEPD